MSRYGIEFLDDTGAAVGGAADLLDIVTPFLATLIGHEVSGLRLRLLILPVFSLDNDLGLDTALAYRSEHYGFIQVMLFAGRQLVYRHPHTVGEVVESGVRAWLSREPAAAKATGYRLVGPDLHAAAERRPPVVAGITAIEPYAPGEKPGLRLRPLPMPQPRSRSLDSFAAVEIAQLKPDHGGWTDTVSVVTGEPIQHVLAEQRYSDEVEEGGFLVGEAFADADRPGAYLANITAAVPAQQTGASLLHFTFTGDSFNHIKGLIDRDHPGKQLLGWYHTHLFPATSTFGLSSIDHRLHLSTFRLPWQVAGLINVDGAKRTLRFYCTAGTSMCQCGLHRAGADRA